MRIHLAALLLVTACSEPRASAGAAAAKSDTAPPPPAPADRAAARGEAEPPDFGDPRLFLGQDSLRWSEWETRVDGDREARLRALGIRPLRTDSTGPREPLDTERMGGYDPYGEHASDFHFIDFSGDGVDDVIYDGPWYMRNESGVGALEGTHIKLYQVMNGRAVEVMDRPGTIQRIWKGRAGQPITFRAVQHGCCAEVHWSFDYYRPAVRGDTVRFEPNHHVMGRAEMVMPTRFLASPRRFTVSNDGYLLRASPAVQDSSTGDWTEWEGRGNAVAEYGPGARGTAIAEQTDATGRVWWFVRMDGGTPPRAAQVDAYLDEHDRPMPTDRLGWMSSRFVTVEP